MAKRYFGQDPIVIGGFYVHRHHENGRADHYLVKVRSVSVDDRGYVRIGCSFPLGNAVGSMDADCYSLDPSLFTFSHHLRAVSEEELPSLHRRACDRYDWRAHGESFVPSLAVKR